MLKTIVTLNFLFASAVAMSEPRFEALEEQRLCNNSGFYYDHNRRSCTRIKFNSCTINVVKKYIRSLSGNVNSWRSKHRKITAAGYRLTQCYQVPAQKVVIEYVKSDVLLNFKTIEIH